MIRSLSKLFSLPLLSSFVSARRLVAGLGIATFALMIFAASPALAGKLTVVPAKRVCMMNNALFEKDQIPVEVAGKTYYGCCQMCKKTLAEDESARSARDPQSGKKVDKATAVTAAREDGTILYFENQASFDKYVKSGRE